MSLELTSPRRISDASVGAELRISRAPKQGDFLVGERLTQKVIGALGRTTQGFDSFDYDFFEGYRSRNNAPGFAIYGKTREGASMVHIVSIKPQQLKFADGNEGSRDISFLLDVPVTSPLMHVPFDSLSGARDPYKKIQELIDNLSSDNTIESDILLPKEFYEQFDDDSTRSDGPLPEPVRRRFKDHDSFSLDGQGRYITVVRKDQDENIVFNHGHIRHVSKEGNLAGLSMTSQTDKGVEISMLTASILAIYGKGLDLIYKPQNGE